MIAETIDLYAYFGAERGERTGGYLTVYARSRNNELKERLRPAVLVVPGGGYCFVSEREGEPIALRFLERGYAAFVLKYTIRAAYPVPLLEGAMAMAYIRKEHEKYFVDREKVAEIGFSAGGHLAGMLATMYEAEPVRALLKEDAKLVRPDAAVLSYAVLSTKKGITHEGTTLVITDWEKLPRASLSIPEQVTKACPPVFLWHTAGDNSVPVQNSYLMAEACARAGVPYEMHIFERGWHGLATADGETLDSEEAIRSVRAVQAWLPLLFTWLEDHGFAVRLAG